MYIIKILGYASSGLIWRLSHPLEVVSFWTGLDFDPHWEGLKIVMMSVSQFFSKRNTTAENYKFGFSTNWDFVTRRW